MTLINMPPALWDEDIPRTRRSDPDTSHIAADVSQLGLKEAKLRVLELVARHQPVAGSHLNDLYRLEGSRLDWKPLAYDSPRKRAGELADDGFLDVVERSTSDGNHLPEAIYGITEKGRSVL